MSSTPQIGPHLVKLDVCLYKKEDVSHDDFMKWMQEEYNPRAVPIIKAHGVVQYSQTATPPCFREPFRNALVNQLNRPKWTVPDYDIVITYWLHDLDLMEGLRNDPKWVELEEEALKWANMTLGHVVIGRENILFAAEGTGEAKESK
ncbi:hypothetical protein QBC43DRAFT_304971 [Cladorrhinum sp. PSN259]|nr:hypothetical protein QBC43DRAFT_304971 [Cladorrhinum sp. PSN259]